MTTDRRTPGGSMLLVDDDETFGRVLAAALTRRGFSVHVAHSVPEARQHLLQHAPEYAVLDLRIGEESGLDLMAEIARLARPPRTVVLTGYGSIATAVQAVKLGAEHYLTKPVGVEELLRAFGVDGADAKEPGVNERPLSVKRLEWEHIQRVLADHGGNISATARALGIHRRTLQRKLQKRPVRF